jgi:hypothetical protein
VWWGSFHSTHPTSIVDLAGRMAKNGPVIVSPIRD